MNNGQKSLSINETFIIEAENDGTMSACTGFYTNALISCSSNVQLLLGNNIIEANSPFSATTFYGDGSNLTGISTQDIFVTGGTYDQNSGIATFINNTGGTFNVTGFYTGATDIYVTAVTFTNNLLTLYRNDGATFGATIDNFTSLNVDGPVSATTFYGDGSNLSGVSKQDTVVTGGTYSDGVSTFTNNTGGTFSITGPSNYYAGVILGAENWVNNGDGSLDLPEIKVGLFDNANNIEPLRIYTISSGTTGVGGIPPLADNDTNYIIIEYNGGSPRYNVLDNDGTVTSSDVVLYMIVYRASSFIHTLEFGDMGAGLTNKLNTRLISTDRFARESGCALGLSGVTGIVTLSSGVVWNGPYEQIVSAVNSQDDIFFKSFHSGGTWVYATTGNTINNDYYDDGTDLVLATAGKYLVNWYFRGQEINDHLYELISYGEYDTVQLAEASPEPNLPELITSHAFLVGRIIVGVSATTGITQSAFTTVFQPSGAPVLHNDLAGIQGGIAGQYYHLDSNKYNNLALTNTNNNFNVGQSFYSGITATTISSTTISLPFSGGSVLFAGTNGQISQDNANLYWDDTNNRLGIGTETPSSKLQINTNNLATTVTDASGVILENNTPSVSIGATTQFSPSLIFKGSAWKPATSTSDIAAWKIFNSTAVQGIGSQILSSLNFQVSKAGGAYSNAMTLTNDQYGGTSLSFPNGHVISSSNGTLNLATVNLSFSNSLGITSNLAINQTIARTSGIATPINISATINPTAGTGETNVIQFTGVINQTGGASGTTRGLYINPTLTAAADFRAIESTNGRVIISDTSTVTGSKDTSLLDLSQTWNTTGNPTALKLNVTNTASGVNSNLIDLQVGGTSRFLVNKEGSIVLGTNNVGIYAGGALGASANGQTLILRSSRTPNIGGDNYAFTPTLANNHTSGTANGINNAVSFTSSFGGSGVFNAFNFSSSINQSGGGTGITRGLYIAPALTAAADFRAIETTVGNVLLNTTSGNTLIGTSTNSGFKLDVNGTARFVSDVTGLSFNATNNGGSYKISGTNVLDYGNGVRIGYFNGVQKITLYTNAGTPQLTVENTGNVLIGTTTDSGFKLDVNGASRVSGNFITTGIASIGLSGVGLSYDTGVGINIGSVGSGNGWKVNLMDNGGTGGGNIYGFFGWAGSILTDRNTSGRAVLTGPSAVLELQSTSKGFLPPRMTTTQRDAIATPATGLTVYDTTTLTPSFYNGTNWQNVLIPNSSGNTSIGGGTAGARLDVRAQGTLSTDIAFRVRNSADTQNILAVNGNNTVTIFGSLTTSSDISASGNYVRAGFVETATVGRDGPWNIGFTNANNGGVSIRQPNLTTGTPNGDVNGLSISYRFGGNTSAFINNSILIDNTINQTGGASGTTRGLYINPTLTSAADFRAIETTVGNVLLNTVSGNTLIGTSTNAGFKLDVNGTARATALTLRGDGTSVGIYFGNNGSSGRITIDSSFTRWKSAGQQDMVNVSDNFVGIAETSAIASAIFAIRSTTRGFLPPRMTTTQRDSIATPSTGLTVYDTTTLTPSFYNGTNWQNVLIPNSSGNTLIGTTVDAGFKLDVNGTARVSGTLQSTYLSFRTADSLNAIYPTNDGFSLAANGNAIRFQSNTLSSALFGYNFINSTGTRTWTSGTGGDIFVQSTYSPTSGTGVYNLMQLNQTINQTGGANGITRGLYINPTLTAAADFRAIENSVGKVCLNTTSGNTMIGTTTDAGFKLDVNGTARVSGSLTQNGSFLVSTTSGYWQFVNSGNVTTFGSYISQQGLSYTGNQPVCINVASGSHNASATFQIDSTTKGFLPPRMTTTQKNAIATPAAGLVVYDTTLSCLEVYDNFWGWMPASNTNEWKRKWGSEYFNDFGVNNTGNDLVFSTFPINGGAASTFATIIGNFIGYQGLQTGVNSNGQSAIRTDLNAGRFWQLSNRTSLISRIFIPTLSTSVERYNVLFGISVGTNSTVNDGCAFVYDEGGVGTGTTASPNWQIITSIGSVRTNFVTSVPVAINTWYSFKIESNSTFTELYYYIDDVLVRTETTNIPTGAINVQPIISITKTVGTTTRSIAVDYLGYKMKLNTAR